MVELEDEFEDEMNFEKEDEPGAENLEVETTVIAEIKLDNGFTAYWERENDGSLSSGFKARNDDEEQMESARKYIEAEEMGLGSAEIYEVLTQKQAPERLVAFQKEVETIFPSPAEIEQNTEALKVEEPTKDLNRENPIMSRGLCDNHWYYIPAHPYDTLCTISSYGHVIGTKATPGSGSYVQNSSPYTVTQKFYWKYFSWSRKHFVKDRKCASGQNCRHQNYSGDNKWRGAKVYSTWTVPFYAVTLERG